MVKHISRRADFTNPKQDKKLGSKIMIKKKTAVQNNWHTFQEVILIWSKISFFLFRFISKMVVTDGAGGHHTGLVEPTVEKNAHVIAVTEKLAVK